MKKKKTPTLAGELIYEIGVVNGKAAGVVGNGATAHKANVWEAWLEDSPKRFYFRIDQVIETMIEQPV